jgi:hypothetical protein
MAVEQQKIKGMMALEVEKRKTLQMQIELQTKMYVTIEQAKRGLLPNAGQPVQQPPSALTMAPITTEEDQQVDNDEVLNGIREGMQS